MKGHLCTSGARGSVTIPTVLTLKHRQSAPLTSNQTVCLNRAGSRLLTGIPRGPSGPGAPSSPGSPGWPFNSNNRLSW